MNIHLQHANHDHQQRENEVHVEVIDEVLTPEDSSDRNSELNAGDDAFSTVVQADVGIDETSLRKESTGRRTIITPRQKKILMDFYNTGMMNTSTQLRHLHEAASDQTGLDINVIKNWIRNRRRPPRQGFEPPPQIKVVPSQAPPTGPSVPSIQGLTYVHTPPLLSLSEPRRIQIDKPIDTFFPTIVKIRIADSEETDFVEVDVERASFADLLRLSCEELGVTIGDVAKVRKLPNVVVRRDRDVARLIEGQELELVLKAIPFVSNPAMTYTPPNLINFSLQDSSDHIGSSVSN